MVDRADGRGLASSSHKIECLDEKWENGKLGNWELSPEIIFGQHLFRAVPVGEKRKHAVELAELTQ